MFGNDFFPTPEHVLDQMLSGINLENKIVLEPSAGKGNIVDRISLEGAKEVLAIEKDPELRKILESKCRVIGNDFLETKSENVSHIDFIVMNPPFSADERHINYAFEIAPPGCKIIALCNLSTVKNPYTKEREQLYTTVQDYGSWKNLGDCFSTAERKTLTEVALLEIQKPGNNYNSEF
jgi:16S rRNA A1518/A1519 N6-dimethyltransferase RsmA/KsgA/DIM1 with predicted DNA glycosylase/AP lyase activity